MKKYILLVFLIAVIGSLVFVPACKRSAQANPDMHEPAGFIINLSGLANPGTLFVAQGISSVPSRITMTALYNDGTPVSGKNIVMKISDDIGYFVQNSKRYAVIMTNSQGKAHIDYKVAASQHKEIGPNLLIYIQAWMQVDLYNVFDYIPIQLVTNLPDEDDNTLAYLVSGTYQNIPSTGGNFSVYLYNSTGSDPITYMIGITDTSMITSPANGTTGTTDSSVAFIVSGPSGGPRSATVTITAIAPAGVLDSPINFTVTQL